MEGKKSRKNSGSSSVGVGIVSFILGFLFAFIVLIGSIFGVGYVVVTTPMDDVFAFLGLNNKNESYDESDPDSNKYNYINSDQAPNIFALIQEVMAMANSGLGEISVDKIDALAPVTDTVLDMAYEYIDEVVDFDKQTFRNVSLVSVLDTLTTSVYYIRTAKVIDLLNTKLGYSINLDDIPVVPNLINGVEAQYATVAGTELKLPVLFDYYVKDEGGIGYSRTEPVDGSYAYPTGLSDEYITETMGKNADGKTLYKVYYVPCKVSGTSVTETEYILNPLYQKNESVSYTDKNGDTQYLNYTFRTIEYGEGTVFVAVKPQMVDGVETFVLDPAAIAEYYEPYARNYHSGVTKRTENEALYGVKTVNGINYFKDSKGNVVDYDPLTVSDIMLDPSETLNDVYLSDLLTDFAGEGNSDMINEVLAGITLGNVLKGSVDFDEVIKDIKISTFLNEVKADDTIMAFIVYNISNVENDGGVYTAIYDKGGENEKTVTLEVDASGVIKSMKDSSDKAVYGNTVKDLNTITEGLTLDIFLDVKADDAIMAYLGYGISDVVEVADKAWQYEGKDTSDNTLRIYTDANGYITKVTDTAGETVKGTTIDEVSDRINGIMDVISIPDLIDINPEEEIMAYLGYGIYDVTAQSGTNNGKAYTHVAKYKDSGTEITVYVYAEANVVKSVWKAENGETVKGTKANNVSNLLDNVDQALRISDFIDVKADNAIMTYVGYGVYGVEEDASGYVGKYDKGGVELSVTITVDGSKIITSVVDENGDDVAGTKIGEMPDRISSLQDKLKIGDIITVNSSSSKVLQAIADSTINGLNDKINTLKIGDIIEITESSPAILKALEDTTINSLSTDINNITIKDALGVTDSSPAILKAIQGYTLGNLADNIDNITIEDALGVTDSSPSILKAIKSFTLGNLADNIEDIKIGDALGVTESSPKIMQAIKNYTLGNLGDNINNLKIGEIVEVDASSSKILQALEDTSINDLDTKIKTLTVEDVLTEEQINANSIIRQIRDKNIFEISEEIDKVLIQRIYASTIYGVAENANPTLATTYNSAYLYYEKVGNDTEGYKYEITTVGCAGLSGADYDNAVGKLTEEQFNAGEYYTYGAAQGMWKLVLYRVDGTTKTEKAYTLNNFNNMVDSCADIVYNSSINELKEAGIIGDEISEADLNKKLKTVVVSGGVPSIQYIKIVDGHITNTATEGDATSIGDFTLKMLLKAITSSL